ncbi:MAG: XRE family transcriptional regulator [Firmicutes bacterium]|nr:XRE family transcriptional regulator [Bacillota bacterium]
MFFLKQYDQTLLSFDISDDPLEGQKCHISEVNAKLMHLLPIGLKPDDESLMHFLKSRIVPRNREFVDAFLAKNGLSHADTRGILRISRGLSLNDSYWIVEDDFSGRFDDFNLYDHDFVKVLSLIAYTGYGSSRGRGFSSSPEFTTGGMLRKGWRRLDGKILLFKGGTSGAANAGNEPYSEYYSSQIGGQMGLNHIDYGLSYWKKNLCSTCELFCDKYTSYVPIYRFLDECSLRTVSAFLKRLGPDYYNSFADMLIFDALICNEDRHFGNFGLMVDNKSNTPCRFAPLFDHGLSLFNFGMMSDFESQDALTAYAATRSSAYGVPFENIVKEFISPRQKAALRHLIGFTFNRHPNYNLPAKRLKAIEQYLQKRVRLFLDIPG